MAMGEYLNQMFQRPATKEEARPGVIEFIKKHRNHPSKDLQKYMTKTMKEFNITQEDL